MKSKSMQRVYKMLKPQAKPIILIGILSLLVNICLIAKPYIIKIIIDDYLSLGIYAKGAITIGVLGTIYISLVIVGNVLNFTTKTASNMMGQNVVYYIRNKLYNYIEEVSIPFHDQTPAGKLFVRITNDVEDIAALFKECLSTVIGDTILLISLIGIMLYISVQLTLTSLIIVPFMIVSSIMITFALNKILDYSKTIKTKLNTFLAESIYGIKLIKIFNRQYEKQKEFEKYTTEFRDTRNKSAILEGLLPGIMIILENLGIAMIVWASVNYWFGTQVQIGIVYVFISYIKQIFDPINRMIENLETLQEAIVSINKIYDILDEEAYLEDLVSGIKLEHVEGKIEFKNVWFAYQSEDWILRDVSFTIYPGESVALVGKTGSRKNNNYQFD